MDATYIGSSVLFTGHFPWDIYYDYKECYEDRLNNYDKEEDEIEWDQYWAF